MGRRFNRVCVCAHAILPNKLHKCYTAASNLKLQLKRKHDRLRWTPTEAVWCNKFLALDYYWKLIITDCTNSALRFIAECVCFFYSRRGEYKQMRHSWHSHKKTRKMFHIWIINNCSHYDFEIEMATVAGHGMWCTHNEHKHFFFA